MGIAIFSEAVLQKVQKLGQNLEARGWMLATAESCTGGGLGYALTSVAGSSSWYCGGVVSYSNDLKRTFLGLSQATLQKFGAVSPETAVAMAEGICSETGANASLAVTGIAGPDGGSVEKPVGTVWLASSDPERGTRTRLLSLDGDRYSIREQAIEQSLDFLLPGL